MKRIKFTDITLREAIGWGDTQLKLHLGRLQEHEYLLVHRHGPLFRYELAFDGDAEAAGRQETAGVPACLLVPDRIRAPVARLVRKAAPRLRVLGHAEIPDTHSIRIGRIIGDAT